MPTAGGGPLSWVWLGDHRPGAAEGRRALWCTRRRPPWSVSSEQKRSVPGERQQLASRRVSESLFDAPKIESRPPTESIAPGALTVA